MTSDIERLVSLGEVDPSIITSRLVNKYVAELATYSDLTAPAFTEKIRPVVAEKVEQYFSDMRSSLASIGTSIKALKTTT